MPTVAMAKGDREAFRAALKVLGNEESDKKGKVADRKPKPAKRAIVDKDGKGAESGWEGGRRTWQVFGTEGLLERKGTTDAEEEAELENSTAKFSVANENDGNWRKAPKSALADRLRALREHASEMFALEREAEACTAANLLLQGAVRVPVMPSRSTRRGKHA